MTVFLKRYGRHLYLLLILVAAVGGLLFLFDVFLRLVSSEPTDLFTVGIPDRQKAGLPSGGRLMSILSALLAFILAAGAVYIPHRWRVLNRLKLSHWTTPTSIVLALALAGLGVFLLVSDLLIQQLPYQDHQVEHTTIRPIWLVVLFGLLFGAVIVAIVRPRGMAALMTLWIFILCVPAFFLFSFLEDSSLAGLRLLDQAEEVQLSPVYAEAVDEYRVANDTEQDTESLSMLQQIDRLIAGGPVEMDAASAALKETGATVFQLESGGLVVDSGGLSWWIPGTTAHQAAEVPRRPVFEVTGAAHIEYLRTATGETYDNGRWMQIDSATLPYENPPSNIQDMVRAWISSSSEDMEPMHDWLANLSLVDEEPSAADIETVTLAVSPRASRHISPGRIPVTRNVLSMNTVGQVKPFSATFASSKPVLEYSWVYEAREFTREQLSTADVSSFPALVQLPEGLPSRIHQLAVEITQDQPTPYTKVKAIEGFLSSRYLYDFSDSLESSARPTRRDPVDWFLFDSREGTSGNFSSAFVVLARSIGIPSRVVSGWIIAKGDGSQTVHTDQSHQWAEVVFDEVGWVTFDPTPPGGARSRVPNDLEPNTASEDASSRDSQDSRLLSANIRLLGNDDPLVREAAARALAELGYSESISPLVDLTLSDVDPMERDAARESLLNLGAGNPEIFSAALAEALVDADVQARRSLLDTLLSSLGSSNPQVRRYGAEILGFMRDAESIEPLIRLTLFDRDEGVRQAGETALVEMASSFPEAFERLAETALFDDKPNPKVIAMNLLTNTLSHSDPRVRLAAVKPLGELGFLERVPTLLRVALRDESATVRQAAATTLGELAPSEAAEQLEQASIDPDSVVRKAAVQALGELGHISAIDPLVQRALYDEDTDIRIIAARSLGGMSHPRGMSLLLGALLHRDPNLRRAGAEALGEARNRGAVRPLFEAALFDEEISVRQAAAKALAKLDPEEALRLFLQALRKDNPATRTAAAEAIAYLGIPAALEPLLQLALFEKGEGVRRAAATAMGVLDSEKALALLVEALEDADPQVREAAAKALEYMGNPATLEPLFQVALFDKGGGVRRAAATAMGALDSEKALALLVEAMEDTDPQVRKAAAKALEYMGNPAALEPLFQVALFGEDESVRRAAATAMGALDSEKALALLVEVLEDTDPQVREATVKALEYMGNPAALEPLSQVALFDESDIVNEIAADAMIAVHAKRAVLLMLESLHSPSSAERETAAKILGHQFRRAVISDSSVAEQVRNELIGVILYDEIVGVRQQATISLLWLDSQESLLPVAEALEGEDAHARFATTRALEHADSLTSQAAAEVLGDLVLSDLLGSFGDPTALEALAVVLARGNEAARNAAMRILDSLDGRVEELENGALAVFMESRVSTITPGTTARRASRGDKVPVFQVSGSANTRYLRTATGEVYWDGSWFQLDPVAIPSEPSQHIPRMVRSLLGESEEGFAGLPAERRNSTLLAGYDVAPRSETSDVISVSSVSSEELTTGVVPTSLHPNIVYQSGEFRPFSTTLTMDTPSLSYGWQTSVPDFSDSQLTMATLASDTTYLQLPEDTPPRIRTLALQIVADLASPYEKAKAIEGYLKKSFSYEYADTSTGDGLPDGRDPVDRFLFESNLGTSGNFSSAFVLLARSIGIPARVVSGWTVAQTSQAQTVYSDQAHQWAEVAFNGLGWVTFDPTPYQGPVSRADNLEEEDQGADERDNSITAIDPRLTDDDPRVRESGIRELGESNDAGNVVPLARALSDSDPGVVDAAREALERIGASVQTLENGSSLVVLEDLGYWVPNTTTAQSPGLPKNPAFRVQGAANTNYLRVTVGEVYQNGRWNPQSNPVQLPYQAGTRVPQLVSSALEQADGPFSSLPEYRLDSSLLAQYEASPARTYVDSISIDPIPEMQTIPGGPIPISAHLQTVTLPGKSSPFSATFSSHRPTSEYSWTSEVPRFSQPQLHSARFTSDPTYVQLPNDLPDRIRELALNITSNHRSPYAKAKAIETYLSTRYPYRFADSQDDLVPRGRDPVDWFLFDHREGTCGVFSSAFVVLARSVGIPSRVVSGWVIGSQPGTQTVYSDQGHQWAEVAFEGLGWVAFEPTAPGAAPSRVGGLDGQSADRGISPVIPSTVIEITESPGQARRGVPFTVSGTVSTLSGLPVSDMDVEIFINKNKEQGGTAVGFGIASQGSFSIELVVPSDLAGGNYQLIAHAIGNQNYLESWSDPDISVYSGAQFELTGPTALPVDTDATFFGRLFEENGVAIGNHQIQVKVDGESRPPITTDPQGGFEFTTRFAEPGAHTIEVEFDESEFILGNVVRLPIGVTLPTELSIDVHDFVAAGEEFLANGTLRDIRGNPVAGEEVTLSFGESSTTSLTTDEQGGFQMTYSEARPGNYQVLARFEGGGTGRDFLESSRTSASVTIGVPAITIEPPESVSRGETLTIRGIVAADGRAFPGVEITLDGEQIVSSNSMGAFSIRHTIPIDFPLGPMTLQVTAPRFGVSTDVTASVTSHTSVTVDALGLVIVGEEFTLSGVLRNDLGEPIGGTPIGLRVGEGPQEAIETDEKGIFKAMHQVNQPGQHTIGVEFSGDGNILPSVAQTRIYARYATDLTLRGQTEVVAGESGLFSGRLIATEGSPMKDAVIHLVGSDREPLAVVSPDESGSFDFRHSFRQTGLTTLTARVSAMEAWMPSSASLIFRVVNPSSVDIQGDKTAIVGRPYVVTGTLRDGVDIAIARETVSVEVDGAFKAALDTDANGGFSWETVFDRGMEHNLSVSFEGTDHLAADRASLRFTVGVPTIFAETPESVARGKMVTIRGTVNVGSKQLPNVGITLDGNEAGSTSRNGTFVLPHRMPPDARLGVTEVEVAAPDMNAFTSVPIEIVSPTTIIATPLDEVEPGKPFILQATLLDDRGSGIPNSMLRVGEDIEIVTDASGIATATLLAHEAEETTIMPLLVTFDGDERYIASTYSLQIRVTPNPFNWVWWVGLPLLVASVSLMAFLLWRQRFNWRAGPTQQPGYAGVAVLTEAPLSPAEATITQSKSPPLTVDADPIYEPETTRLDVTFLKPTEGLPDVWGLGEEMRVRLSLCGETGSPVEGASVRLVFSDSRHTIELVTDSAGNCTASMRMDALGSFEVTAEFEGIAGRYVKSSGSAQYRVVDFREEIVRLYNLFLDWTRRRVEKISNESTPREVEAMLATSQVSLDERALEQVIARFEEADYSEHVIGRPQYVAMLNAWSVIVKEETGD